MARLDALDQRWIVREREDGTNVNSWHWTNKDLSARGTSMLKESLECLEIAQPLGDAFPQLGVRVRLTGIRVNGTVEALNRKGRRFLIYELDVGADWSATVEVAGPSSGDEVALAAEGEDDEALARRMQAEEDASAARAASCGVGAVRGRVSASEWTHDEEDEPPFSVELTTTDAFRPPLSAELVRERARRELLQALGRCLRAWARRMRDDGTGPEPGAEAAGAKPAEPAGLAAEGGERREAAAASAKPSLPSLAGKAPPPGPRDAGTAPAVSARDAAEELGLALSAFCARSSRTELALPKLRLTGAEVATLRAFLRSPEAAALRSLDLAHNALGDEGAQLLAEALTAGAAPGLQWLGLGGNRVSAQAQAEVGATLRASRPGLALAWQDGPQPQQPGGAGGEAEAALCLVGTVHLGSPAAEAGLQEGDRLLRLGLLLPAQCAGIEASIVPLIRGAAGQTLPVEVLRSKRAGGSQTSERLSLQLRPREWSGSGLLGCILHPNY